MQDIDKLRLVNEFYDIVNHTINRYGLKDYTTFYLAYYDTYIIIEIYLLFYNKYFYLVSDKFDSDAIINKFPEDITPTIKTNNLRLDIRLAAEACEIILRTFSLDQKEDIEICQTHIDLCKSKDNTNYNMCRLCIDQWCESFRRLLDLIDDPKECIVYDSPNVCLADDYGRLSLERHHVDFMEWW
jgi:hypothetical protein